MNDHTRKELEAYFDGVLATDRRAEVERIIAEEEAAARYLAQLGRLRDLARAHASRCVVPHFARDVRSAWGLGRRSWRIAAAGVAAGIAAVILARGWVEPRPHTLESAAARPFHEASNPGGREDRMVQPERSAIVLPSGRFGKRKAAVEIRAFDFANADPAAVPELETVAIVQRGSTSTRVRIDRHPRRTRTRTPGI